MYSPPVKSELSFLNNFFELHLPLNHVLVAKSNYGPLTISHRHHPLFLLVKNK